MTDSGKGASVRLQQVAFSYGAVPFVFDLDMEAGSRTAVMGPSGSGKSTLLSLIAGFERPDSGHIEIGGIDVTDTPPAERPVSMIFQENNLFAHLDVAANVGLGRSPALRLGERDRAAVTAALTRVGLAGKEARRPAQLSGGERQRVAIARTLVRDRPVLLLDEALASLDRGLREDMHDLLKDLLDERGMTLVMVTHDEADAQALAQRLVRLEAGRIVADTTL